MRKVFAVLTIFLAAMTVSFAEESTSAEKSSSDFEKVLLQKGTLLCKEFKNFDKFSFDGRNADLKTEIATLTDVNSGLKVYALRLSNDYYNSQYDSGTAVGVLDAKELASIVTTFKYIKTVFAEYNITTPYEEIIYTSNGGVSLGAYHVNKSTESKIFIKINYKRSVYCSIDKIDSVIAFFEKAQKELESK